MCKSIIRLRGIDTIERFVKDIESIDGEVNFKVGRIEISARSIMNIFILDLSRDLVVTYRGDDRSKFQETMSKYKE